MKLTQVQAQELIAEAWKMVEEGKAYKYRFGQALFNLTPAKLSTRLVTTDQDFFYDKDTEVVLDKFYRNCVMEVKDESNEKNS